VRVFEGQATIGGGTRTADLTLPGFRHDVCSAIHPLISASPFFRRLELDLAMVESPAVLAHPLDDGSAVVVHRSLEATASGLGVDGDAYRKLLAGPIAAWPALEEELLAPLAHVPRHPVSLARFAATALRSVNGVATTRFRTDAAQALFAGVGAHSVLPLEQRASASFALVLLVLGHVGGWPFARGGSQSIAAALADRLRALGGEIETGHRITSLQELPPSDLVLCDVAPRGLLDLTGDQLPTRYRRRLQKWRHGPGVFKVDYALDGPIPWTASEVGQAATVHLGGTLGEIADSERAAWTGRHAERPFVLLAQHSLFDETRAPKGKHTAWAYCHVPNGSTFDMRARIEAQIERFAPGFGERVLASATRNSADLERENPNLVGGDIGGGANTLGQLILRPAPRLVPYSTPVRGLYLCSSSTPPGGGVHGLCGHLAAKAALQRT
jgi:phytoene dehydrogenase-like protein